MNHEEIQSNTVPAKLGTRALAALCDYVLFGLVFVWYLIFFGEKSLDGTMSVNGIYAMPLFLFWMLYFPISESLFGYTLFKYVFGIEVINIRSNKKLTIFNSLIRRMFDPLELLPLGVVGLLVASSSRQKRRLGDRYGNAFVVGRVS